jgi:hypothetical protein
MSGSANFMPVLGGIILVGVIAYLIFYAANTMGLENQTGTATVVGKEYRPAGVTYRVDQIGGKPRTVPQANPEKYLLKLSIGGKTLEHAVSRELYESLNSGDQVEITYRRKRITGAMQVIGVKRR